MTKRPRTIAIVQARMGSSRLPGKVLLDLAGQPVLARVLARTQRARLLDGLVVATTGEQSDAPIETFCRENGYTCFRGSTLDVLDRTYQAALDQKAEVIVRITADCPVIDPQVIDRTVTAFFKSGADFAANRLPPPWRRTYPIGLDVEVCDFPGLQVAWMQAGMKYQREHVMPFFYDDIPADAFDMSRDCMVTSPRGFKVLLANHIPDLGAYRWAVDALPDLELMRRIFTHFAGDDFSWKDLLALVEREPELLQINETVSHKTAFDVDARNEVNAGGQE
jgi:spore coat polysaccharide biosynthesis protein SpsF